MSRASLTLACLAMSLGCSSPQLAEPVELSNWKLTLPVGDPTEVEPPELLAYATDERVRPYFYRDPGDGALVFHTEPQASTKNSRYSRTELREQLVPGSDSVNWTLEQGGSLRARIAVSEISRDAEGKPHRTVVAQIHGRRAEGDPHAPPLLKVSWFKGRIRLNGKRLADPNASEQDARDPDAWVNDDGHTFEQVVGAEPFTLQILASAGRVEVVLNGRETHVYDSPDLQRWTFENYFKAGNYLSTRDEGAFATVKVYELIVSH